MLKLGLTSIFYKKYLLFRNIISESIPIYLNKMIL